MKSFLPALFFILVSLPAKSQDRFFKFFPGYDDPFITSVYSVSDGLIWCLNNQNSTTFSLERRIVKTDFNGNTNWILAPDSNNFSMQYACEPAPGVLILGGFYNIQGQFGNQGWGIISRVDAQGNVVWAKKATAQTSAGFTGVYTSGEVIYALFTSYSIFSGTQMYKAAVIAYDLDGNKLWENLYGHPGLTTNYYFQGATIAQNGDLIAAVDVRGSQNVQVSGIVLTRISPQGVVRFTKHINWHADFQQSTANGVAESPDGNIYVGCRLMTDQSSNYPNALWIGKFGSDGEQLDQRMYSAGEDVGENIAGMKATETELVVYVKRYSPFETVQRHLDLLAIDYSDLSLNALGSTDAFVVFEDVYGEDPPQLAIGPDGSFFSSAIVFCEATQKGKTSMFKWSPNLETECSIIDASGVYTDSVSTFTSVDYTVSPGSVPTYEDAGDIGFVQLTIDQAADFCAGCDVSTNFTNILNDHAGSFYPNPATELVVLRTECMSYNIRDLSGRTIKEGALNGATQISLSEIPKGLYFMTLDGKTSRLLITN